MKEDIAEAVTVITAEALEAAGAESGLVHCLRRVYPSGAPYLRVARELQIRGYRDEWVLWMILECPLGTFEEHVKATEFTYDADAAMVDMVTQCKVGTWDDRMALCRETGVSEIGCLCDLAISDVPGTVKDRLHALAQARSLVLPAYVKDLDRKHGATAEVPDVENEAGAWLTQEMVEAACGGYDLYLDATDLPEEFTFIELASSLCEEDREWLVESCGLGTWEEHLEAAAEAAWHDDVLDQMVIECPVGTWDQRLELCRSRGARGLGMRCRMALSCVVGTLEQRRAVIAEVLDFIFDCELKVSRRRVERED